MEVIFTFILTSVITFFVYEVLRTFMDKLKRKRGKDSWKRKSPLMSVENVGDLQSLNQILSCSAKEDLKSLTLQLQHVADMPEIQV